MRIETAEIDRYGLLRGCQPQCDGPISIIAGPNESGKTLFLEGLLQLMDPDVASYMDPEPRVSEPPVGRVVVQTGNGSVALGDERPLSDVAPIEPRHLTTVFVIRDSDLALPDGTGYYTELVDHLGDIHTAEIASLRETLREEGRLTPSRLDLANRDYDTKRVHQRAKSLAADIDSYVSDAREEGVDTAVRERLGAAAELRRVEEELDRQKRARARQEYETAQAEVRRYRKAVERLTELEAFDRETLETLRSDRRRIERLDRRVEELEDAIEEQRTSLERLRADRRDAEAERSRLNRRADDVEELEGTLDRYRAVREELPPTANQDAARLWRLAVGGMVGGGAGVGGGAFAGGATGVGTIAVGLGLLLVALLAGVRGWQLRRRAARVRRVERDLLRSARDAGLAVDEPEAVATALGEFEEELELTADRERTLSAKVEAAEERLEERVKSRDERRSELDEARAAISRTLEEAGVGSVDAFAERVTERDELDEEASAAASALAQLTDEPAADDPREALDRWEDALTDWRRDLGPAEVEADAYDAERHERLMERREQLRSEIGDLEDRIADFQARCSEFARRADGISVPPFVDVTPRLEAETVDGLADLRDQLNTVVDRIEGNAERSRKAIAILDGINRDEEAKVSTLFARDGPAARTLARLTGGRYTAVVYDPDAETLAVERADGVTLSPAQLSRATRDQLYFAARLSLARQLLGGEPGFLLLDDPFLAADPDRLREGFETLAELADDGWQIIYLTAKAEVWDDVGPEFGCTVDHLDVLEY